MFPDSATAKVGIAGKPKSIGGEIYSRGANEWVKATSALVA